MAAVRGWDYDPRDEDEPVEDDPPDPEPPEDDPRFWPESEDAEAAFVRDCDRRGLTSWTPDLLTVEER